jgi:hypothetical protein
MLDRPQELGPLQVILEDATAELNGKDEREAFAPKPSGNGLPGADVGAENMAHAGSLVVEAMRNATEESCKRALTMAESAIVEAAQVKLECERLVEDLRRHGESVTQQVDEYFARTKTAAAGLASLRQIVQGEAASGPQQ